MINEQELSDAVDRLREGDSVMGITPDDAYKEMLSIEDFGVEVLEAIHADEDVYGNLFLPAFHKAARKLLIEAYRTKLEGVL